MPYYEKDSKKHGYFYSLDCCSGEGLINLLLPKLIKISNEEFEFYLHFFLKRCININRNFEDSIEFLSIWLEKSPYTLLDQLKARKLKPFFHRTEYDHDGDKWYFPRLIEVFSLLINEQVTAKEILDYIFDNFDFFNMPDTFIREIIGYDRLEACIEEVPSIFREALILKINEFINLNKAVDMGIHSYRYLNAFHPTQSISIDERAQYEAKDLISYVKNQLFYYPPIQSEQKEIASSIPEFKNR